MYWSTSESCTTSRNHGSSRAPPPATGNRSNAGAWLTQYTQTTNAHCSRAARSRNPAQSPATAIRNGMNKNAQTGIRMVNNPYQGSATRTYCSGVMTKNTQNRGRWSAGRVGVKVKNSRNAPNDASPNRAAAPMRPSASATAQRVTMTHHARSRALRFPTVARRAGAASGSAATRRPRTQPTTEASARNTTTPATRAAVGGSKANGILVV